MSPLHRRLNRVFGKEWFILLALWWSAPLMAQMAPSATTRPISQQPQCGHYAILHCCEMLGVPIEMSTLLGQIPPRQGGHSMLDLAEILGQLGLQAEGRKETIETMRAGHFPAIAHTGEDLFVVIEKMTPATVMVLDGDGRRRVRGVKHFEAEWDGKLLWVSRPRPDRPLPDCPSLGKTSPRIQFKTLFIDQGQVPFEQDRVEYVFEFRNAGTGYLSVDQVRTGCGCLRSEKLDKPIPPGQDGRIVLTYVPNKRGAFSQTAYVHSNDSCTPVVRLTTAGNTDQRVIADPESLDLGKILYGQTCTRNIMLTCMGDEPLRLTNVTCDVAGLNIHHAPVTDEDRAKLKAAGIRVAGDLSNSDRLTATYRPSHYGTFKVEGKIEIVTNIKGFGRLVIPVRGEVTPPVRLMPSVLFFGEVNADAVLEQSVDVIAVTDLRFKVRAVDVSAGVMRCSYPEAVGPGPTNLRFHCTGADALLLAGTTVSVHIEVDGQPGEIVLPLKIYARPITLPITPCSAD